MLVVRSKLGHYEAELTDTLQGVEVKMWLRYQDGNMRRWISTDIIDAPFHYAASHIHDILWNAVPDPNIQGAP
jgi:hypothetical protein